MANLIAGSHGIPLQIEFSDSIDGVTAVNLHVLKPNNRMVTWPVESFNISTTDRIATYFLAPGDLDIDGRYVVEVEVISPDFTYYLTPGFILDIRPRLTPRRETVKEID